MDFQTFVKKYSFVDSRFINDFYNIIKEDYIERYNEFLIDSELLRKWLNINIRRSFNDTIKRSYVKDIDYTIETIKRTKKGSGGQNFEVITLTPEAANTATIRINTFGRAFCGCSFLGASITFLVAIFSPPLYF